MSFLPIADPRLTLPSEHSKERALFSIRSLKYFLFWLLVWQDNSVDGSPLQLYTLTGRMREVHPIEVIFFMVFLVFALERLFLGDLTLKRSYFWAPLLTIFLATVISWARGCYINQALAIPFEVHESFLTPIIFAVLLNMFREPEEGRTLIVLLLYGTIAKGFDGLAVYFFSSDPQRSWGVLQMWRDGYLLAIGIVTALLLLHYKGTRYLKLRRIMAYALPILSISLILSFRRTFIVGLFVSIILMFFTIGRGRRARHGKLFLSLLLGLLVVVLVTDPIGFLARISGILDPGEEGSAYIRLMEYPNVLLNIWHNPIWGTAIGTQWHQYYRMPLYANFTTLGTHNTYLYWPLRTGLLGTVGFFWLLARAWKFLALQYRLATTEEEFLFAQIGVYAMVLYMIGCMFGLMYGDAVTYITAMLLVSFQLQLRKQYGIESMRDVEFIESLKARKLIFRAYSLPASSTVAS